MSITPLNLTQDLYVKLNKHAISIMLLTKNTPNKDEDIIFQILNFNLTNN